MFGRCGCVHPGTQRADSPRGKHRRFSEPTSYGYPHRSLLRFGSSMMPPSPNEKIGSAPLGSACICLLIIVAEMRSPRSEVDLQQRPFSWSNISPLPGTQTSPSGDDASMKSN